jgi:hypothetical protein
MSARMLAVITPGDEAAALSSLAGLATIARAAQAEVRLAYVRDLPPPRLDRHDRPIADTDAEMARISGVVSQALGSAARVFDDVAVETVVRFGKPRREAAVEADVYAPQIVVVFAAARTLLAPFRSWALRRGLARRPGSKLLVLEASRKVEEHHGFPGTRRAQGGVGGHLGGPQLAIRPPAPLPARRE